MKEICTNCSERNSCVKICTKVEKLLPEKRSFFYRETPVSNLLKRGEGNNEDITPEQFLDHLEYKRDSSLSHSWEEDLLGGRRSHIYEHADLNKKDYSKFQKYFELIPKPKQKAYLKSYLQCDTITQIANRANTTKQNIHKHLSRALKMLRDMMSSKMILRKISLPPARTPRPIKKWYQDLISMD